MHKVGSGVPHTGFDAGGSSVIQEVQPISTRPDATQPDIYPPVSTAAPDASQGALVAGGVIGGGIVDAIARAGQGRLAEFKPQPENAA